MKNYIIADRSIRNCFNLSDILFTKPSHTITRGNGARKEFNKTFMALNYFSQRGQYTLHTHTHTRTRVFSNKHKIEIKV